MPVTNESQLEARTAPVQQRGLERVDKLLDTAASIIDDYGIAALTTSAVAEGSGSSVGVVYRYFPNVDALLLALSERNRQRFNDRLAERVRAGEAPTWRDFARLGVRTYADFARTEPAFATLRVGDVIAIRFSREQASKNQGLADGLKRYLVELYGFASNDDLHFATVVAMECTDALVRRAFIHDRDGDERYIEAAEQLVIGTLLGRAPGGAKIVVSAE